MTEETEEQVETTTETLPADHHSGYVAVIGRPNVGKSTLSTACWDRRSQTSPKPQTTRDELLGIYTQPDAQIIF